MKKLVLIAAALTASSIANASYLYWTISGSDIESTGATSARIAVYDKDGKNPTSNPTTYLYLMEEDMSGPSSYTVAGVGTSAQPASAAFDLGSFGTSDYSYVVELGSYDNSVWSGTYVSTKPVKYDDAVTAGLVDFPGGTLSQSAAQIWAGQTYAVPEPTGALLVLIGAAMLGLKRRKV